MAGLPRTLHLPRPSPPHKAALRCWNSTKALTVMNDAVNNIGKIRVALGPRAVLLRVTALGKNPIENAWQRFGLEKMSDPAYLQALETDCNIGVALGSQSEGLCTVDIDVAAEINNFLVANPRLAGTLRTTRVRGANFWLQIDGTYPKSGVLRNKRGEVIGEWRSNGNQTVIWGKAIDRRKGETQATQYRILSPTLFPARLSFADIVWPADWQLPWMEQKRVSSKSVQSQQVKQSKPSKDAVRSMLAVLPKPLSYEEWIKVIAAVGDALGDADAEAVLNEWDPEDEPRMYAYKLEHRLKDVAIGTLIYMARQAGWKGVVNVASLDLPRYFFDPEKSSFLIPNERDEWIRVNETAMRRELRALGFSNKVSDGAYISPLDEMLSRITKEHDLNYAGPLAGYKAGLIEINSRRVLVMDSPRIIKPCSGRFDTLWALVNGMLNDAAHDQLSYLLGWLKCARESLECCIRRPGQALTLAGTHDSGKSLLQVLITELLGGREARPYRYMSGHSEFNRELFGAEHLVIEDDNPSTDLRSRRSFGARIKEMTVNSSASCHGKNREALSLKPFWRLSISVNDEPENLMMLPPLDDSLCDKLILLRVRRPDIFIPSDTPGKERFLKHLISELPAFCHFLAEWTIPQNLVSARFGIQHFLHPDLVEQISSLAPEAKLLDLIDTELFAAGNSATWQGSAAELERLLSRENSDSRRQADKLFSFNTACGVYLSRLAALFPKRFIHKRRSERAYWIINPPGSDGV